MEYIDEHFGVISRQDVRTVKDVISGYTFFKDGDVLFAKITPCMENGKAAIARGLTNGIGFGSTEFHVVRPTKAVLSELVFYFLRQSSVRKSVERRMTGSAGQQRVPVTALEELELPLPSSIEEQNRLASLLSKVDHLRRTHRYAQHLGDTFLQSVFVEMFGDTAKNPQNFDTEELGSFVKAFEGGINFNPVPDTDTASQWRVLKVSAVTWGDFNPDESKPIGPDEAFDDTMVVKKGDLLISRANTTELVGAVCLVRNNPPKVLLPDKLWRVKFVNNCKLDPNYVLHALRQPALRNVIGSLATGSSGSMKNISKEKAATLPILIPPRRLQEKFAGIVQRVERLRTRQLEAARQAEHLFQTLLHRAFSDGI